MPGHDSFEQAKYEATVFSSFVFSETGDRVGNVREDSIIADDCAEIRCFETVNYLNEFSAVIGVDLCE